MKQIVRFVFVVVPAGVSAVVFTAATGSGAGGAIMAMAVVYLGLEATKARPERGERR